MAKIHLISGKGGVGKTTYAKALHGINPNWLYAYIADHDLNENKSIPNSLPLNKDEITKEYIQRVLKSKQLSKWIYGLSIFQSIFNMIPFMNFMIYLGKLVDLFEDNPNHPPIIFDAPSSGHFLTMLESLLNFKTMLKKGILFNDANRMLDFLKKDDSIKIHLITQPMELDIQETIEFRSKISNLFPSAPIQITCNKVLAQSSSDLLDDLLSIEFYKNKIQAQKNLIDEYSSLWEKLIPYLVKKENLISEMGSFIR